MVDLKRQNRLKVGSDKPKLYKSISKYHTTKANAIFNQTFKVKSVAFGINPITEGLIGSRITYALSIDRPMAITIVRQEV